MSMPENRHRDYFSFRSSSSTIL